MTTHSSILVWKFPCIEDFGGLQSHGVRESDTTEHTYTKGNGEERENIYANTLYATQFLITARNCIILIAFTLECRD